MANRQTGEIGHRHSLVPTRNVKVFVGMSDDDEALDFSESSATQQLHQTPGGTVLEITQIPVSPDTLARCPGSKSQANACRSRIDDRA